MKLYIRSHSKLSFHARKLLASLRPGQHLRAQLQELNSLQTQSFLNELSKTKDIKLSDSCCEDLLTFCRNTPDQGIKLRPNTTIRLDSTSLITRRSNLPAILGAYACAVSIVAAPH